MTSAQTTQATTQTPQTPQATPQATTNRNFRSLAELRAEIEQEMGSVGLLGWMLTWSIRKTLVALPDLKAMLIAHGIDGVDVQPVRQATSLKRALASLSKLQQEQVIVKVRDDDERLVYVVGEIEKDRLAETLGLRPGMKVAINKKAMNGQDPLEFEDRATDEALRPVIEKYANAWVSRDISDKIMRDQVRKARGFRGREDGGVYFLFASEKDTLLSLLGFVQDLSRNQHNGSYLTYVPVPDLRSAQANLGRHAHDTVLAELRQMELDLVRFEDAEARAKARPNTIGEMLVRINDALAATDLYEAKLAYTLDDVRTAAGKVRHMARAVLNGEAPSVSGKRYDAQQQQDQQQQDQQQETAPAPEQPRDPEVEAALAELREAAGMAV